MVALEVYVYGPQTKVIESLYSRVTNVEGLKVERFDEVGVSFVDNKDGFWQGSSLYFVERD